MKLTLVFLAALFFSPSVHAKNVDDLVIIVDGKENHFSLAKLKKALKTITVTLDDPVYHARKSFDGFLLTEALALAGLRQDSRGDEIVFTAKDGYAPNTSFAQLRAHEAVLTFQEHGKKKTFGKVAQGKAMVSPGPYYVVWTEGKALAETVPWPYQLAKIEIVDFARKYDKIFPKDQAGSEVLKGFLTFKSQCIRCHSLNLQGGDLGPELNVPKNITEYWDKDILRQFIRNASSFRLRDKMPSFPDLKDSDLNELLAYLTYMKEHKIQD